MNTSKRARDLLWADLALQHGVTTVETMVAALRERWSQPHAPRGSLGEALAAGGLARDQVEHIDQQVSELIAAAGGEVERALHRRGSASRAIQLTLEARSSGRNTPGPPRLDSVRTIAHERFSDFLVAGEGGMGVVYMALDADLQRFVAFKMIRPPSADGTPGNAPSSPFLADPTSLVGPAAERYAELVDRFLQEAWITGGLEHPGIVPVHEVGRTEHGIPFYTMRFVSGQRTLADAIQEARGGRLADRLALLEPFLKVCDAIEYAHTRGVVHRDIKPGNVALGEHGEVLVLDWGLARLVDGACGSDEPWRQHVDAFRATRNFQTQQSALGTPGYMAPERVGGAADASPTSSDVYSLGAVLYEILTGRLPHGERSWLDWISRDARPEEPAALDPAVPAGLSTIALAALDPDPARRPDRAGWLAAQVRQWQVDDAEARELDRLEREARTAVEAARAARGDERVRHAERALLHVAPVRAARSEDPRASSIGVEAEALRVRGLRERTWRAIRLPVAVLLLSAAAAVGAWLVIDRIQKTRAQEGIEAHLVRAEAHVAALRADAALDEIAAAASRQDKGEREGTLDEGTRALLHARRFRALCDALVQKGDLPGLAVAITEMLQGERADGAPTLRAIAGRALFRIGAFEAVPVLLEGTVPGSSQERELLDIAHAWPRGAGEPGDMSAEAWAPLHVVRGPARSTSVAVTRLGSQVVVLSMAQDGRLRRWAAGEPTLEHVPLLDPLRDGWVSAAHAEGCVLVSGMRDPARSENPAVVFEVNLATSAARLLWEGAHGPPRAHALDIDGDGNAEVVLTFAVTERGAIVLDADGRPWSATRHGALSELGLSQDGPDILDAAVHETPAGRCLLLATGNESTALGFRVLCYRWDAQAGALAALAQGVIGPIADLVQADTDGDRVAEMWFANSIYPFEQHAPIHASFRSPGIHEWGASGAGWPASALIPSGYHVDRGGQFRVSPIHWAFSLHGAVRMPSGRDAIVASLAVLTDASRGPSAYALLTRTDEGLQPHVIPGVRPVPGAGAAAVGDILPAVAGEEVVLVQHDGALAILGVGGAQGPRPRAQPAAGRTSTLERFATALEVAGHAGLSAGLLERIAAATAPTLADHARRWLDAAQAWTNAGDTHQAWNALTIARSTPDAVSDVERLYLEGLLASLAHRGDGAHALFGHAARALATPEGRARFERLVPAPRARRIEAAVATRLRDMQPPPPAKVFRLEHGSPEGLPAPWQASRPGVVGAASEDASLRLTMGRRADDFVGLVVQTPALARLRIAARIEVESQVYGAQLCVGLSSARPPDQPPPDAQAHAALLVLKHVSNFPRGVQALCRTGFERRSVELTQPTPRHWEWGRTLLVEIDYDRRLGQVLCLCTDELTGLELGRTLLPLAQGLPAGTYLLGLWGTSVSNPWMEETRFVLHDLTAEIAADGPVELVDLAR